MEVDRKTLTQEINKKILRLLQTKQAKTFEEAYIIVTGKTINNANDADIDKADDENGQKPKKAVPVNDKKSGDEQPRRIEQNLFEKPKTLWQRLPFMSKPEERDIPITPEPESIEPLLYLMKENGYTDVLTNVKSGEFIMSTPKGEKSLWLYPYKKTTIRMPNNMYYKAWIAHENEMLPYPHDPVYSSEMIRKITQKIAINYRDLNEAALIGAKTKMWLFIIGGVVVALFAFMSTPWGKQLMDSMGMAEPVIRNTVENITQNMTNVTTSNNNVVVVGGWSL